MQVDESKREVVTLNAREFRFVENYCCGPDYCIGNAFRSALNAGYSHDVSNVHASKWVRNPLSDDGREPNPKPHIFYAIMDRQEQLRNRTARSDADLIAEIEKLAYAKTSPWLKFTSDGSPYIDASMMSEDELTSIQGAEIDDYWEGRGEDARLVKRVKLRQYDKKGALDLLAKIRGLQKTVHSNDPENPMPAAQVNVGVQYDLSKLDGEELDTLARLLKKATPDR